MKNLLKKTVSLLAALALLLVVITAFADEAAETEWENLPTFEIGRETGGTFSPDTVTEIRAHAGRRGDVLFTLTLAENCEAEVTWDGSGVRLSRPDGESTVYTFIRHVEWDEYHVISMTSSRRTAYTLLGEIIPDEPVAEPEPEPMGQGISTQRH